MEKAADRLKNDSYISPARTNSLIGNNRKDFLLVRILTGQCRFKRHLSRLKIVENAKQFRRGYWFKNNIE